MTQSLKKKTALVLSLIMKKTDIKMDSIIVATTNYIMQEAIKRIDNWIALNSPATWLNLSFLNLTKLPPIPPNCLILNCAHNYLKTIPALNCMILNCSDNLITSIERLDYCQKLYCDKNNLTFLPKLPCCIELHCSYNKLFLLPQLSTNALYFFVFGNKYLYLPKKHRASSYIATYKINYSSHARTIQKAFKNYLKKKYMLLLKDYLYTGPCKIVCSYV